MVPRIEASLLRLVVLVRVVLEVLEVVPVLGLAAVR